MIEIRRWDNNEVIFYADVASIKEAVELAVSKCVSLAYANLIGADLSDANLFDANLFDANLFDANLESANLFDANLSYANLSDANLIRANLPHFSIVPETGSFKAYKKLLYGVIVEMTIPARAKRTSSLVGRKCRASEAKVTKIIENPGNIPFDKDHAISSTHYGNSRYFLGATVKADKWDDDVRIECTNGIHFFMTLREAQE